MAQQTEFAGPAGMTPAVLAGDVGPGLLVLQAGAPRDAEALCDRLGDEGVIAAAPDLRGSDGDGMLPPHDAFNTAAACTGLLLSRDGLAGDTVGVLGVGELPGEVALALVRHTSGDLVDALFLAAWAPPSDALEDLDVPMQLHVARDVGRAYRALARSGRGVEVLLYDEHPVVVPTLEQLEVADRVARFLRRRRGA